MNPMRTLLLVATAAAAAAASGGSRARNNPSPPTHPLFLFTTTSLLLSLLQSGVDASDRPPMSFTQDYEGGENGCLYTVGTFIHQGFTADGRPWYMATVDGVAGWIAQIVSADNTYLYYDADCDGNGGSHPQWVASIDKPDPSRLSDLDGDKKCLKGGGNLDLGWALGSYDGGGYSRYANYDWTPDTTDLMQHCGPCSSWGAYTSSGNLAGCTSPYPSHTYPWSEWESTDIAACKAGRGTEKRREVETCLNPEPECPCTNRRDPATLGKETRACRATSTTTSTTSSTTTTTTLEAATFTTTIPTTTTSSSSSATTIAATKAPSPSPSPSSSSSPPPSPPPPTTIPAETPDQGPGTEGGEKAFAGGDGTPTNEPAAGNGTLNPAASEDEQEGDDDEKEGLSGGMIAALVIVVCIVIAFVGVFEWRQRFGEGQQPQPQPAASFNNRMFSVGRRSGGGDDIQSRGGAPGYDGGYLQVAGDQPVESIQPPCSTSQLQDHGVGDGQQQDYAEIDEGGAHAVQQPYSTPEAQVANVGRNGIGGDGQEQDYAEIDDAIDGSGSRDGGRQQQLQQRDDARRCQYTQAGANGKQCKSPTTLRWCVVHGCETANCSNSKSSRVKVCGLCQRKAEHSSSRGSGAGGAAAARSGGVHVRAVADDGHVPPSSLQTELYDTGAVPGAGGGGAGGGAGVGGGSTGNLQKAKRSDKAQGSVYLGFEHEVEDV